VEVRPATEDDLEAVLPLYRAYCDFYERHPPDEGLLEICRSVIADHGPAGWLLVGDDDDGNIVGFALMDWKFSSLAGARVGFLEDLYVATGARGSGLAEALIDGCANRARARGCPVLQWLTQPDNKRARTVYERVGATGEHLVEYVLDLDARVS
jgi:GNAT superfamily N-acetyltransferase